MNKENSSDSKNKKHHIKVHLLCYALIFVGIVFCGLTVIFSITTMDNYKAVINASQKYIDAEESAHDFQDASDFLTEMSRLSVNLANAEYMRAYCEEITMKKRRDADIAELDKLVGKYVPDAMDKINAAMTSSTELCDSEYHAMKLVAVAANIDESELPGLVLNYELTEEELALSAKEQESLAFDLLNNQEYTDKKDIINGDIKDGLEIIKDKMLVILKNSKKTYGRSSEFLRASIFASALDLLALGIALISYLLYPMRKCIKAIEDDKFMPECSSYEMSYLVNVYNEFHAKNRNIQNDLRKKAEHDALTGLLNRGAFESLCTYFTESRQPMALMIMDVDDFKKINDEYGHQTGDLALVKLAKVLKESFRSKDFVVRYGGDEFVVFMHEMTPQQKHIIKGKLNEILDKISVADSECQFAFSISAGIAFSENGYSEELFNKADEALYDTKAREKGSYTFI